MDPSFWDTRYGEAELAYGEAPNAFLSSVVDQLPSGPILCLGAGEGRNAVYLAARDRGEVTALDQSAVGLDKAARWAASRGLTLSTRVADLSTDELGGPWSVITAIWTHVPPDVRRRMFREAVDALAPGGCVVVEMYTPDQVGRGTGGPPNPALTPTLAQLREELSDLTFEIGRELEREVHEGRYHDGLSAVVQVLARKA